MAKVSVEQKFSIGQEVIVVDESKCYSTYYDWVSDNKLCLTDSKLRMLWVKYLEGCNKCEKGTFLTIIACGTHNDDRDIVMYLCEDSFGDPVLISEDGLDILVERKALKWTDLKVGDVLRKKNKVLDGYRFAMVTVIDAYDTSKHIQVGFDWYSDEELAEDWEKVEE